MKNRSSLPARPTPRARACGYHQGGSHRRSERTSAVLGDLTQWRVAAANDREDINTELDRDRRGHGDHPSGGHASSQATGVARVGGTSGFWPAGWRVLPVLLAAVDGQV